MKFKPESYDFVFSLVDGNNNIEKINNATDWANIWLKFKSMCGEKGSIVFDIDDTLVDSKEKIIPSMVKLYKTCQKFGFITNIVTARPESKHNRAFTENMLKKRGIDGYEALYMMPSNITPTFNSISEYKHSARTHISKRHKILANFGDMWTDHLKFPSNTDLNSRSVEECAILFPPNCNYACIKLPGAIEE
tara:strand:- start:375 stop:950 length:576 start_codon:yes stop_codon:yes gene_type:complete